MRRGSRIESRPQIAFERVRATQLMPWLTQSAAILLSVRKEGSNVAPSRLLGAGKALGGQSRLHPSHGLEFGRYSTRCVPCQIILSSVLQADRTHGCSDFDQFCLSCI